MAEKDLKSLRFKNSEDVYKVYDETARQAVDALEDVVEGKQSKIDAQHKLSVDLVDGALKSSDLEGLASEDYVDGAIETVEGQIPSIDGLASEDYVDNAVSGKQETLVSGTNIKTINNQSILGEGNITIEGGSGGTSDYTELTNKPQIEGVTLTGNKTAEDLGLATEQYVDDAIADIPGVADIQELQDRVDALYIEGEQETVNDLLSKAIDHRTNNVIDTTQTVVGNTLQTKDNNYFEWYKIPNDGYTSVTAFLYCGIGDAPGIVFTDSNNIILGVVPLEKSTAGTGTYTSKEYSSEVPEGTVYIYIENRLATAPIDYATAEKVTPASGIVAELKEFVDAMQEEENPDVDLFQVAKSVNGSINLDGTVANRTTASLIIPVVEGTKIKLKESGYTGGTWTLRCCFTTDNPNEFNYEVGDTVNLVAGTSVFQEKNPNAEIVIDVPEGAKTFWILLGAVNTTYEYNYKPQYLLGKVAGGVPKGYSTIKVEWHDGNPINIGGITGVGNSLVLGVSPTSGISILHTKLYNVTANTNITVTASAAHPNHNLRAIFFDKNYLTTSAVVDLILAGETTNTVKIPANTTMMALQYTPVTSGGALDAVYGPDVTLTYIRNDERPYAFYPRSATGYQNILVRIALDTMYSNLNGDPSNTYNGTTFACDNGILCLPENYDPNGEPVKLICFTHGHAVTYTNSSTAFNATDIKPEYWLSEGYAIFDMDGSVQGTFSGNHDYESGVVLSYDNAYKFITEHYNVRKDGVYTTGRSMGGGMQFLLAKRSKMPIVASCPMVPVSRPLGYVERSLTGAQRKELLATYGVPQDELDAITWTTAASCYYQLSQAERDCIVNNQFRFAPFMPNFCYNRPLTDEELCNISEGMNTKNLTKVEAFYESVKNSVDTSVFRHIPFKIFTCVTDPTVWYEECKFAGKVLANAGHIAEVHVYPTPTDHTSQSSDHRFEINLENCVTITNSKGVEVQNVPKVYIETLAFWRRFDPTR